MFREGEDYYLLLHLEAHLVHLPLDFLPASIQSIMRRLVLRYFVFSIRIEAIIVAMIAVRGKQSKDEGKIYTWKDGTLVCHYS